MNRTSDYIRRDKAINTIAGITTSMSVCLNLDECHGMKKMQQQAVMEIANMPSADVQPVRWIPCSERLPENDCQCIVTAKVKHVDGYPDYEVDTADYTDGIFTTANSWWGIESIIAWMPLPEPWEGAQE